MSLNEGKDNLAYRNYKMSDEFKNRMIENYKQMLNASDSASNLNSDNIDNNDTVDNTVMERSNIVEYNELEQRRNNNKKRNFDGLIKVGVASFAIIASAGAIKLGMDGYKNAGNVSKKVSKQAEKKDKLTFGSVTNAMEELEDMDKKDSEVTTQNYGETESMISTTEVDESKFPSMYSECYDDNGELLDGYAVHTITAEYEGKTITTKIVGRDFCEVSEQEYLYNYEKENGRKPYEEEGIKYVYYLQGTKFCRTACYQDFPTERYDYKKIADISKIDGKIYIYTADLGQYENNLEGSLPGDKFFSDCNLVALQKYVFKKKGKEDEYMYMKAKQYKYNSFLDHEYTSIDLVAIDDKGVLWYFKDLDTSISGSMVAGTDDCTYAFQYGDKFKKIKVAKNLDDATISYNSDTKVNFIVETSSDVEILNNKITNIRFKNID